VFRTLRAVAWAALLGAAASRAETPIDSLVGRLRRPPPATQTFHEIAYRRALKAPLVSRGTYTWFGGLEFERVTSWPYDETARASGGHLSVTRPNGTERHVALERAPVLEVLFSGLSAVLSGDSAALDRSFQIDLAGESTWRLRLVPRDEALRTRVPALVLRGESDRIRCAYFEGSGSETLTLLGDQGSPRADEPFSALVQRYCPGP
jgi:hypothetical protein